MLNNLEGSGNAHSIKLLLVSNVLLFLLSCSTTRTLSEKPVTAADAVWNASNLNAFEEKLETLRKQYHIPSLSVGIVNEKKLTWKKGFGFADVENKKVPDENTVYQLASITKTFGSISSCNWNKKVN